VYTAHSDLNRFNRSHCTLTRYAVSLWTAQPTSHCRHTNATPLHLSSTASPPLKTRRALSCAFAAYAVLCLSQTNMLIERLCVDKLATAVRAGST
jgi:hypothetical protein